MESKIATVYEMMFPYGLYTDQPGETCAIIDRELRRLCKDNRRDILLIIGRFLKLGYSPFTPTHIICGDIQNMIRDMCLSLPDYDKAKYIVGLKTGIAALENKETPLSFSERIICNDLIHSGFLNPELYIYTLFTSYEAKGFDELSHLLYRDLEDKKYYTFEELWNDPHKQDYIFILKRRKLYTNDYLILRIAGSVDTIKNAYANYMEGSAFIILTHQNYLDKMELYEYELNNPYASMSPLEIFKEDTKDKDIYLRRYKPKTKEFLNKLYDRIMAGEIEVAKIVDGRAVFTRLQDIC